MNKIKKSGISGTAKNTIFSCSHISKKFDQTEVLRDVSFTVAKNEKIGLVGANGSGKSTLLKIIAGLLEKDGGVINCSKKIKIEYLPQIHLGTENENLSGGEIAKKILQNIMVSTADLFILDEPTNNLDEDGLRMVENLVLKSSKAFLIVSHDRMFLDNTVTKIVEIDHKTKSSYIYDGNYSEYAKERKAKIERLWKEYSEKVEKVERLHSSLVERVNWVREIENKRFDNKNLPMHEKEKPQAAYLRDKEGRAGRRAKVMKDRLEKYQEETEEIKKPYDGLPLKVVFENERGGVKVFEIKDVVKEIGDKKIGPVNLRITYGDRLHIVGKNGAGKTTLLKMLLGEILPTKGVIERGENVKIGYISQERWFNRTDKRVIREFLDITEIPEPDARQILNRFKITEDDVKKHISELSPGEYSRVLIAELVAMKPNCIILDEPSNHLDLEVLEELESGLEKYEGTLIVVSHDRYFVQKIRTNRDYLLYN
ncbi:MAG: ABC-F family ATP-binding cassette domain-containing protein [Candidatus Taylorbacteria bacterium]|nr:ABC-F family ATP-binding cassette domain-containing protein [Candidatus Taylorbacteria bacterium]